MIALSGRQRCVSTSPVGIFGPPILRPTDEDKKWRYLAEVVANVRIVNIAYTVIVLLLNICAVLGVLIIFNRQHLLFVRLL